MGRRRFAHGATAIGALDTDAMNLIDTTHAPAIPPALPNTLRLGAVHLTVADLDRAVAWYERSLGLRVHAAWARTAELGDGAEIVVVLHEDPDGATGRASRRPLPLRAPLPDARGAGARGAAARSQTRTPIQGASDHRHARGDLPARR